MRNNIEGTIIKGVGGLYTVRPDLAYGNENIVCRARGVFRYEKITPLPGDRVIVESEYKLSEETAGAIKTEKDVYENTEFVITKIFERKNILVRPPLANLTHLFAVISAVFPKPDLYTADKLLAAVEAHNIEPVIIVNKADLDLQRCESIALEYKKAGYEAFAVSAETGHGFGEIGDYILSETIKFSKNGDVICGAFSGASGVGKSSILSELFPALVLQSGELSKKTERGRHTTRHAELYPVRFGDFELFIADTPGFSLIDFERFDFMEPEELPYVFREFRDYLGNCRYKKCAHLREDGCAILSAVKNGSIGERRHKSYTEMYEAMKKKPEWKRRKERMSDGK